MFKSWPNPRAVASWCSYDFANSVYVAVIPATIWSAYYAEAICGGGGVGPLWWGRVISVTMLIVALSSPLMGAIADMAGWRKRLLVIYTLASVVATGLLATVGVGMILYGFILSVIAGIGFEGAMVFYNAYMTELSPPERQGRLSGMGYAIGYAGSFIGLVAVLPLVGKSMFAAAFAVVAFLYLIFAIPSFIWLPGQNVATHSVVTAARDGWRATLLTARDIWQIRPLRRFLISYFVYQDGVLTIIVFSSIFARQTLGFAMQDLIPVYIVVQIAALIGNVIWAKPTDTKGPKFVVMAMIVQWIAVVIFILFVHDRLTFFIMAALAGTGLGAIQAASRTLMATFIPQGREGEFFGFYSLCGKSSSILGPLVFGWIASMTGGDLRLAALSIVVFFVVGGGMLLGVNSNR